MLWWRRFFLNRSMRKLSLVTDGISIGIIQDGGISIIAPDELLSPCDGTRRIVHLFRMLSGPNGDGIAGF